MSERDREQIFGPFFTSRTEGVGTGLGLATVHGIVEQSGGAITVESVAGEGSCFLVYLPRSAEMPGELSDESSGETELGIEKILVVEDESSIRRVMRRQLERAGYSVVDTGDPEEA